MQIMIDVGPDGRGVFAARDLPEGEVIEHAPVILVPPDEAKGIWMIRAIEFYRYGWVSPNWSEVGWALVLGYGSLYNHSTDANIAYYQCGDHGRCMVFVAARDVKSGEELRHDYKWHNPEIGLGPIDEDFLPVTPEMKPVLEQRHSGPAVG